jgi:squalene-hopene/tetraprenyl-beta-curcumene cyclase
VPFADHNAMLDPTCADITGRVLEAPPCTGWIAINARCGGAEWLVSGPGKR